MTSNVGGLHIAINNDAGKIDESSAFSKKNVR
jgi:hypothetical protein